MIRKEELIERGWSDSKIKKWLGDLDIFELRKVIMIENSTKFINWKKREKKRTDKSNLSLRSILEEGIHVEKIPIDELLERAIKIKVVLDGHAPSAEWIFDNRERIIKNFIRHSLISNYDDVLKALNGHCDRDILYQRLRKILETKINEVYPNIEEKISMNEILFVLEKI